MVSPRRGACNAVLSGRVGQSRSTTLLRCLGYRLAPALRKLCWLAGASTGPGVGTNDRTSTGTGREHRGGGAAGEEKRGNRFRRKTITGKMWRRQHDPEGDRTNWLAAAAVYCRDWGVLPIGHHSTYSTSECCCFFLSTFDWPPPVHRGRVALRYRGWHRREYYHWQRPHRACAERS